MNEDRLRERERAQSHVAKKLDVENERGIGRDNATGSARTVAIVRADRELSALANLHLCNTFIPSFDDLASTELEAERLITITGAVELASVRECAGVMNLNHGASRHEIAFPGHQCLDLNSH